MWQGTPHTTPPPQGGGGGVVVYHATCPLPAPCHGVQNGPLGSMASRGARAWGTHGNTREYTGIRVVHPVYGNTREHTGIREYRGYPGIPGIPGIPVYTGNNREYREYREYP